MMAKRGVLPIPIERQLNYLQQHKPTESDETQRRMK